MRTFDRDRFNFWLSLKGPRALENLAVEIGIGFYTLKRIRKGEREPKLPEQLALCKGTGLTMDELFPVSKQEESA
jgi:transcriptional regulator with XRE-family HTH domain